MHGKLCICHEKTTIPLNIDTFRETIIDQIAKTNISRKNKGEYSKRHIFYHRKPGHIPSTDLLSFFIGFYRHFFFICIFFIRKNQFLLRQNG